MKISALTDNPAVLSTDVIPISKGDASASFKTKVVDLADFIAGELTYLTLNTTAKTLIGALNELALSSGYVEVTGTLTAGNTSITLSNNAILTTSTIDIYTDVYGLSPTNVVVATGSVTLTFEAQSSDVSVKVRVS